MVATIAIALQTVPRQVDGENGQTQHHPAENRANQRAIVEHRVASQLRMSRHRIDQRTYADPDGRGTREQHAHGENLTRAAMNQPAFLGKNGSPKCHQAHSPGDDVRGDEDMKKAVN